MVSQQQRVYSVGLLCNLYRDAGPKRCQHSQTYRAQSPLNLFYTWCNMLLTRLHHSPVVSIPLFLPSNSSLYPLHLPSPSLSWGEAHLGATEWAPDNWAPCRLGVGHLGAISWRRTFGRQSPAPDIQVRLGSGTQQSSAKSAAPKRTRRSFLCGGNHHQ